MHIFDENDENKLEYTSVFESYVLIMDDLIDMKLNSKFGEAAVITMIVEAKQKSHVLENLAESLKIDNSEEGFIFESTALLRCS